MRLSDIDALRARIRKISLAEANKRNSYFTVGATMPANTLFVDIDSKNFDIYGTKDGIFLVAKLKREFDYHFRRIRLGPKLDRKGRVVNPAPELLYCHCPTRRHIDKRLKGRIEIYKTNSD